MASYSYFSNNNNDIPVKSINDGFILSYGIGEIDKYSFNGGTFGYIGKKSDKEYVGFLISAGSLKNSSRHIADILLPSITLSFVNPNFQLLAVNFDLGFGIYDFGRRHSTAYFLGTNLSSDFSIYDNLSFTPTIGITANWINNNDSSTSEQNDQQMDNNISFTLGGIFSTIFIKHLLIQPSFGLVFTNKDYFGSISLGITLLR